MSKLTSSQLKHAASTSALLSSVSTLNASTKSTKAKMIQHSSSEVAMRKLEKIRSLIDLFRKGFECTICIDYYVEPVITNCQHTFCKSCIENYIGTKRYQDCPLCKSQINMRSLKEFNSLNDYVALSKELEASFEADCIQLKSSDPESLKNKFAQLLNVYLKSPHMNLKSVDLSSDCIANIKRKRSLSDDSKSTKKIKSTSSNDTDSMITKDGKKDETTSKLIIPNTAASSNVSSSDLVINENISADSSSSSSSLAARSKQIIEQQQIVSATTKSPMKSRIQITKMSVQKKQLESPRNSTSSTSTASSKSSSTESNEKKLLRNASTDLTKQPNPTTATTSSGAIQNECKLNLKQLNRSFNNIIKISG